MYTDTSICASEPPLVPFRPPYCTQHASSVRVILNLQLNINHFLFIVSDDLAGNKVRKTNREDTTPLGKQRDLKGCQTKLDDSFPGSSQQQILQENHI